MALDYKKLIEENHDLLARIEEQGWEVSYNKRADMIFIAGNAPSNSTLHHIDDTGFMIQLVDGTHRICGFAIEDCRIFAKTNPAFALALMPFTNPQRFRLLVWLVRIEEKLDARSEATHYLSSKLAFGSAVA